MNVAIKGHPKRGNEVIEILEMFGGKNIHRIDAIRDYYVYFVMDDKNKTISSLKLNQVLPEQFIIYSLEEFLEKFPYKVGDKVYYKPIPQINSVCISEIISMRWIDGSVVYYTSNGHEVYACDLQPYKEETMEEKETMKGDEGTLVAIDLTREFKKANEIEVILGDYEFVLKDGKTYFVKKNKYPKTYEECCGVIGINRHDIEIDLPQTYQQKMFNLFKLLICRDAYWKIAGEQMGLGKAWKPDFGNDLLKYYISFHNNKIDKGVINYSNKILAFPTEEMRDDFYNNFKDLIENCKELL